uniref:Uncharacterized protein n=1 Tax=Oryza barthii TaxID=65489 RepID=A0A0D3EYJ8_9ORYZ
METFAPGKTQTQGRSAAPDTPRLDAYNGRSSLFPRPLQHAAHGRLLSRVRRPRDVNGALVRRRCGAAKNGLQPLAVTAARGTEQPGIHRSSAQSPHRKLETDLLAWQGISPTKFRKEEGLHNQIDDATTGTLSSLNLSANTV